MESLAPPLVGRNVEARHGGELFCISDAFSASVMRCTRSVARSSGASCGFINGMCALSCCAQAGASIAAHKAANARGSFQTKLHGILQGVTAAFAGFVVFTMSFIEF